LVAELHLRTAHDRAVVLARARAAFTVADGPATAPPLIQHII
jgi:hypothetical protein